MRDNRERFYSPVRHDYNFEYKLGLSFDCVFYLAVIIIVIKLISMYGH